MIKQAFRVWWRLSPYAVMGLVAGLALVLARMWMGR